MATKKQRMAAVHAGLSATDAAPALQPAADVTQAQPLARDGKGRGATTVTIACKVANGVRLRLCASREISRPVIGGGTRISKEFYPVGDSVVIRGPAKYVDKDRIGETAGGFAMTAGVNREFWEKWLEQNRQHAMIKNGLLFAAPDHEDAKSEAQDHNALRSNMEPLDMSMARDLNSDRERLVPRDIRVRGLNVQKGERDAA